MRAVLLSNLKNNNLAEKFLLEVKLNGFFSKKFDLNEDPDYKKIISEVDKSDFVFILKSRTESTFLGYIIAKCVEKSKPTLIFLYKHKDMFFNLVKKDKVLISIIKKESELSSLINKVIKKAIGLRDKRFNFFISSDLLNYLEEIAKINKTTKSSFLRKLILDYKNKHS